MICSMLKFRILCVAGGVAWATAAVAQGAPKVGQAELVRNEVVNVDGAQLIPINVGDGVARDDVIRTSANSDARFGLIDNTKLTLGPSSELKIDRAVFADESRYKQITIRLTEGAFRFVTGNSDKKSYRIETPSASIGVRGTILDIRISQNQTLVALQDGKASVCAGSKCTQLLERGHTANVTREGGVTQIKRDLVPTWTFASVCSGNSALCSPLPALTKKANLTAPALGDKAAKTRGRDHPLLSGRPAHDRQRLRTSHKCHQGHVTSAAERPLERPADPEYPFARCVAADAEQQHVAIDGQLAGAKQFAVGNQPAPLGAVAEAIGKALLRPRDGRAVPIVAGRVFELVLAALDHDGRRGVALPHRRRLLEIADRARQIRRARHAARPASYALTQSSEPFASSAMPSSS